MFYEKLRELRKKKEISQEDLADILEISKETVSSWESGVSMPDLETVLKLSDLFEVSIDYLLKDRLSDSEFSYYTKAKEAEKKLLSKNKLFSLVVLILSVMGMLTLLSIALIEPLIIIDNGDETHRGFFAYYFAYPEFQTATIFSFATLVLSASYLIIPEQLWANLFRKKN